jgi:hypothetical protein
MKKILTISVLFFAVFTSAVAQITFRNTYSGVTISSVSQTSSGGYIIAGYSTAYSIGSTDIVLIRTDNSGAVIWSNTFGNNVNANADDVPSDVVEIPGGAGYYVAGQFWNQGNNTYEVYILKTDTNGTRLWSRTMFNGGYDKGTHVENDGTGGCFLVGWMGNSSRGYLGHLDGNGTALWQYAFTYATGAWVLESGRRTADGGMICGGYDNEQGTYEMFLMKTDATGAIQWQRGYAMASTYNFCYDICITSDNGYVLAGGSAGINLVKVNSSGNIQWANTYTGAFPRAYSIMQCTDLGFIVLANDVSNFQYLMKTDSTGNVLWTTQYSGGYFINTVEQTADGGFIFAMGSDIIKTDANGISGCGESFITLTAVPLTLNLRGTAAYTTTSAQSNSAADGSTSPVIPVTYCITTDVGGLSGIPNSEFPVERVGIFDVTGRELFSDNLNSVSLWSKGKENEILKNSSLPPGIYFVRYFSGKKIVTRKVFIGK